MPGRSNQYDKWMRRAIALAKKGEGFTAPNPMVGAVILRRGKVLGEGYHKAAGLPHAEIEAINDAKAKGYDLIGATIVVSLEPCCHHGKTPPCADAIIEHGLGRVVVGCEDPNPCVSCGGIDRMKDAGIKVIKGVLEKQCMKLNEPFFHAITTGRPLVVVKVACSLDGKIATRAGHSQWISGPKALKYAHRLRARYDAILVGLGTVLADDPQLTYRGSRKVGQPLRVILDSRARIPLSSKAVSGELPGKTLIAVSKKAAKKRVQALKRRSGVQVVELPDIKGRIDIGAVVSLLSRKGINSLLIEGGGTVLESAFRADVVDQVRMVMAPMIIGGKDAVPVIGGLGFETLDEALRLEQISTGRLGDDLLIRGKVKKRDLVSC